MPKALEEALLKAFYKKKRQGKLKGVSKEQYVYGSKAMQAWFRRNRRVR
jgi:hypothetical protein